MNRKAAFLMVAMTHAALITSGVQANEVSLTPTAQVMEPIVITGSMLPSASAIKLERIVVTAKRDLSDIQSEPLASSESKATGFLNSVNGPANL